MSHVLLVDPARQVPAYDRALAESLALAGWGVSLATAPRIHDGLPPPAGAMEHESFGLGLPLLRRIPLSTSSVTVRRLQRALGYPWEWSALGRDLGVGSAGSREPWVLHSQWALLPPLENLAFARARRRGVPVIHTVHNVLPHEPRPLQASRWRKLYASVDALIVHSTATRDRLRRLLGDETDPSLKGALSGMRSRSSESARDGRPHPPIHVVPMGPFAPAEPVSRADARRELGLPADAPLALLFGLLRPYKGLDLLLEAMTALRSRLPGARLVVAGPVPGGPSAGARWQERIASLGLGELVLWRPGYVPEAAVAAYLSAADVVVAPYRSTDDSAVLALARGHGRAVVATDVGGLREALADGGRTAVAGDPRDLSAQLLALLDDPAARETCEAAQRRAGAEWTWDDVARATIGVYREALASMSEGGRGLG